MPHDQHSRIGRIMHELVYNDLVERYGHGMAYGLLLTIKRMAKIEGNIKMYDKYVRLQFALNILSVSELLVNKQQSTLRAKVSWTQPSSHFAKFKVEW